MPVCYLVLSRVQAHRHRYGDLYRGTNNANKKTTIKNCNILQNCSTLENNFIKLYDVRHQATGPETEWKKNPGKIQCIVLTNILTHAQIFSQNLILSRQSEVDFRVIYRLFSVS